MIVTPNVRGYMVMWWWDEGKRAGHVKEGGKKYHVVYCVFSVLCLHVVTERN